MLGMSSPVHTAARLCRVDAAAAMAHLSRAEGMGRWCLGLWHTREVSPGLFSGQSLFDGGTGWVRVTVDAAAGRVHYAVGATPDRLVPRIEASVVAGECLGHAEGSCVIAMIAWRTADMDDARWQRLMAAHEVELDLIRTQLETRT